VTDNFGAAALRNDHRDRTSQGVTLVARAHRALRPGRTRGDRGVIDNIPGTVFAVRRAPTRTARSSNYQNCYVSELGPTSRSRTYPVTGNHEYDRSATAVGYVSYWGTSYSGVLGGDPSQGYYSYDLGAWHIVVLTATTRLSRPPWARRRKRGSGPISRRHDAVCARHVGHSPRFYSTTSSTFFPTGSVKPFWTICMLRAPS